MNDRIRISTEWLNSCANQLSDVKSVINDAAGILSSTDTSERSGGQVRVSGRYQLTRAAAITGDTVAALVASVERAMTEMEDVIARLDSTCRKNAAAFENAEASVDRLISAVGTGRAPEKGTGVQSIRYPHLIESIFGSDKLYQNEWEEQDEFINTQFNKDLISRLHDAIVNEPLFSEDEWKKKTDRASKEEYVRQLINRINELYGTDLKGGVVFNYPGQTTTKATYYRGTDYIAINNVDKVSYRDILTTLLHENRHNLQQEIIEADNLDTYSYGNQEDAEAIDRSRVEWDNEWTNYVRYEDRYNALVDEFNRNTTWLKKVPLYNDVKKDIDFTAIAFHEYAEQQLEVDARYTENHVPDWLNERRNAQKNEQARRKAQQYTDTIADPFDGVYVM